MKTKLFLLSIIMMTMTLFSCRQESKADETNILFLHHSTGGVIWQGTASNPKKADLPQLFARYNKEKQTNYVIIRQEFPKAKPYGWNNYPFDYYNIWVKNASEKAFMEEPTLETLTKTKDVIIFKHCFPVSNIQSELETPDIDSDIKTLGNYKMQYEALKEKVHDFADTKFIIWTGAVQVKAAITEEEAIRAKEFVRWVIEEWDQPDDNIFLWDFYHLETEGGLYLKDDYAVSSSDSHPNREFAGRVVDLLFNRVIDVIENSGQGTTLTGERR